MTAAAEDAFQEAVFVRAVDHARTEVSAMTTADKFKSLNTTLINWQWHSFQVFF